MITVITPVLNGQEHVEGCIENVAAQDCPDVEHLIVDGGSTDGTIRILQEYAARYRHIRWISGKDKGQSDAMNRGIQMAKGQVIGFLNVDDFYEAGTLKWVTERFKTLTVPTLLVGNCNVIQDDGSPPYVNRPSRLKISELLTGDESRYPFPVNPSAYFCHRSLHDRIGLYDVDEHYAMDLDFILRAALESAIVYEDRLLGNFRLIKGTKTARSISDGTSGEILWGLIRKYRSRLPVSQRLGIRIRTLLFSLPVIRRLL